jgi:hypothetical protein
VNDTVVGNGRDQQEHVDGVQHQAASVAGRNERHRADEHDSTRKSQKQR